MNCSASILTHPTFNGPKVSNPIFRGRKKGCISLGTARRKAKAATYFPTDRIVDDRPADQAQLHSGCAQLQQLETLIKTADVRAARRMQEFLQAVIDMEINRRIREGVSK